jgi:N-acetylneuraminic acid mutarotase
MMFHSLLTKLETELRDGMSLAVAGFVTTARAQLEGALAEVDKERTEGLAAVTKERDIALAEVDTRRAELTREVAAMHGHKESQEGRVELNIGGYRFETSVQTLRRLPHTFFDAYFSGRYAQDVCNDGSIFVDRNGEHFGHILQYLRDGVLLVAEQDASELDVSVLRWLKREFGFYCIELNAEVEDEEILVVGCSYGQLQGVIDVKRYDVASGTWREAAPMIDERRQSALCVLDGEVYATGGISARNIFVSSMVRYSPSLDRWCIAPALPRARYEHSASVVGEAIYILGGLEADLEDEGDEEDEIDGRIDSVLKFDSKTQKWSEVASMPEARCNAAVTVLGSDIYVFGGDAGSGESVITYCYNTISDEWMMVAPMPVAKSAHSACVLDGLLYVMGGFRDSRALDSVHRFDPVTNTWSTLAPMLAARSKLQSVVMGGSIYAIGGWNVPGHPLSSVERYDANSDTWAVVSDMAMGVGRSSFGAVVMGGPQEVDLFDSLVAKARRAQQ